MLYSLVDQASGGELRVETVTEDLRKSTLVVIKALSGFIVDTADIDDNRTSVENGRVSSTL